MARMKTGRLTPRTTDPQGNRIADPEVKGKKINDSQTVSSWPEVRDMYKSGKFKMRQGELNPQVKSYLEGKTNKLDDKEFEEPIISKERNAQGSEYATFDTFYRKGGKNYARVEKNTGLQPSKEGQMNYYDSAQTDKNINEWRSAGAGAGEDINRYRTKKGEYKDGGQPIVPKSEEITFNKLPLLKPTKIETSKRAIIKAKEKPEPESFVNPSKPSKKGKDVSMNPFAGGATSKGAGKRYVKQVIGSIGKTGDNSRGYNREEKLFKAKASTGAANLDISDMSSKDIKGIRKDYLKKDLSAARTDNSLKPEERAKKIAAAKMEIKQSRQGQRYTTKMEKGKLSYFTPGYNEGKNKEETPRNDRGRIYEYKSSQDNINNKNTIDAKLKAIGEKSKSKPGSFGSMPTS